MYDINHTIQRVDLARIRLPHNKIALDSASPLFNEPLVNLKDYDIPFLSWHAIEDGSNPPYCKPIQGSRQEGWLRKTVAEKLQRANKLLHAFNAELIILDAYRSIECQRGLWAYFWNRRLEENPHASEEELRQYALGYVRDPRIFNPLDAATFPIHITGSSIDVTIRRRDSGEWLNMGSKFEEIIDVSRTDYFECQLEQGLIDANDERLWNRRLMDWALRSENFLNDPILYWHYDWGNQIWIKVKNVLHGEAPPAAWYGHIPAPEWGVPEASMRAERPLSPAMMALIKEKNKASLAKPADPLSRLEGGLAVHCRVDLEKRQILEAASMATLFKGYEALLPGRDLQQVGMVSCTASGICGGVHATASALCLEMALGLQPPPLGIVLRNLLLSCQYLNDNCMHLFVLAGPDYSQQVIEQSNPEIWHKAQNSRCQFSTIHDYQRVGDIMRDLNKGSGKLYKEALKMVSLARQAYTLLGGKFPHSESIIPGGVTICVDADKLAQFHAILQPFTEYSQKTAALWDDIFNFMLSANPAYENVGRCPATMLDFGQWDHPDYYDGRYETCDIWGAKRWSTPAMVLDGKLACTQLSLLNAGMEEFLDYSWQSAQTIAPEKLIRHDPNGNPVSAFHPWNKRTQMPKALNPDAYSWGSSLTWRGHGFEVGAYARLYLTALAQKIPASEFLHATGSALQFALPLDRGKHIALEWRIPAIWNAFERNRARACALAFSLSVTLENIAMAQRLIASGETQTHVPLNRERAGQQLGVGLWGASRGFLAHWAVIADQVIDNYQIAIPSRVNVGTRSATGELGPLEKALINTPILETQYRTAEDFSAIDIQRTIQSFDPCMNCSAHVLLDQSGNVLVKQIDTSFPI